MATPQPNPRRRHLNKTMPAVLPFPLSTHTIDEDGKADKALRKSSTFHSPTTPPSEDEDPIVNILRLPRRTPTDPKALEDVVAAREQRITSLIGSVERSLSGLEAFADEGQNTSRIEDLPVPRFILDENAVDPDRMEVDTPIDAINNTPRVRRNHHASDSGIGSSISESIDISRKELLGTHESIVEQTGTPSGVNGSTSLPASTGGSSQHALSEYACRQIQKHIISPIVNEASLKPFHTLVTGIPYRVNRKEITCLRDLEKVLLWLAPKWSSSKRSYLHFCETSIQCIHTTVEYLNESDQRRPTDRPYTNGYFLDLTEQIRQYAAMISAARQRRSAGRATTDDAAMEHETVRLRGGYSENGRPAELVRIREGQTISLRNGEVIKSSDSSSMSPTFDSDCSDDEVLRSMGRRKKNAPPVKDVPRCSECEKTFKRPCDLTKHEKTHSRPWKCVESSCKYHAYGWPTEKERDRHTNDKHSATPSMYRCQYHPCPYESKRESNCKQHMEKAHGWAYIRSKNNGKTRRPTSQPTPPTPQLSTPQMTTPGSHFGSPGPSYTPHMSFDSMATPGTAPSIAGSTSTANFFDTTSPLNQSLFGTDGYTPIDTNVTWNESYNSMPSAGPSASDAGQFSWEGPTMIVPPTAAPVIGTTPASEQLPLPVFEDQFDWANMDLDQDFTTTTSFNVQMVTPASSVQNHPLGAFDCNASAYVQDIKANHVPSLSPGGQGDVTLLSPSYSSHEALVDEGYEEFATEAGKPTHDFDLYGSSGYSKDTNTASQQLFHDLSPLMPAAWPSNNASMTNMEH